MVQNLIPVSLINNLQNKLDITITGVNTVSGGDINHLYKLQGADNDYLLKLNDRYAYPGMFLKEKEGLSAISKTASVAVPQIILQGDFEAYSYLVLQWIDAVPGNSASSAMLGTQLAQMHGNTDSRFGFFADNYMGSLAQSNRWHNTWSGFFIEERLQPMVKMAVDKNELTKADVRLFEEVYKKLPSLFDEEPPSLIHGDLWSGNYLIGTDGVPYLIDPAVSYSNREFDIAMTTLFGGFDNVFYQAYHEAFPLPKGWQQRLKLWNLYPLLIHVNLFGGGYARQVRQNLSSFI
ncbi:fructosamine kinase family protein [Mucilaginibacter celer]|uniref:Fructosamine kinase n=1 Tax=Mucilaginibacter celer TaxID=2305508 RepID=A0A494VXC5_9SPHI|nr:fructosamine kinase family protein [Mucilaginibacter celer]AYL95978.1 fructosamine kinase [Mucilaginibacter celer]